MQNWTEFERHGWSWSVGHNSNYGGYYAQAWRDYPQKQRVEGRMQKRECFTEGGATTNEAELKLQQRLRQLCEKRDGQFD